MDKIYYKDRVSNFNFQLTNTEIYFCIGAISFTSTLKNLGIYIEEDFYEGKVICGLDKNNRYTVVIGVLQKEDINHMLNTCLHETVNAVSFIEHYFGFCDNDFRAYATSLIYNFCIKQVEEWYKD